MFENKVWHFVMILVGFVLIGFGVYIPDSFLPPTVNVMLGVFTVVWNAIRIGMAIAEEEDS